MKNHLFTAAITFSILFYSFTANAYTIFFEHITQEVIAYEFTHEHPDGKQPLYATDEWFAQIEGTSYQRYPDEAWVQAGTSASYGTSKTMMPGEIISQAHIQMNIWYDFNGLPIETGHYLRGTYKLNITSDFNNNSPVDLNINIYKSILDGSAGMINIYNDSLSLIHQGFHYGDDPFPGENFMLTIATEKNYFLEIDWFENILFYSKPYTNSYYFDLTVVETRPVPELSVAFNFLVGLISLALVKKLIVRIKNPIPEG